MEEKGETSRRATQFNDDISFWRLFKRPKIDYIIICIAFLLVASSQVFESPGFRASGTIEVSDGSAIPQDTYYTLTTTSVQPVTSAVLLDEPFVRYQHVCSIPVENVNKLVYNITLQSTSENSTVRIIVDLNYDSRTDRLILLGTTPVTYTFELYLDSFLGNYDEWAALSTVYIDTGSQLNFKNILIWAEFDIPLSPSVINFKSTDGSDLFGNTFTRQLHDYTPSLRINPQSYESYYYFPGAYPNRTLYLKPQNYSFTTTWGKFYARESFNVTIYENTTSSFSFYVKAVKINLSISPVLPMIQLIISDDYGQHNDAYFLFLKGTEIPDYLYVPPYPGFNIEVVVLSPFTWFSDSHADLVYQGFVPINGSHNLNVNVVLPYVALFSLQITPHDFIQISLAAILFTLAIIRIFLYTHKKKPRTSWKDPRLIPVLLIGMTAIFPWFSATRNPFWGFDSEMHIVAFGIFPLMAGWTEWGSTFLIMPSNGVEWAILSLLLFWIPIMIVNYLTIPHCEPSRTYLSAIPLFAPHILLSITLWRINVVYFFITFTPQMILATFLLIVPSVFVLLVIIYEGVNRYKFQLGDGLPPMTDRTTRIVK